MIRKRTFSNRMWESGWRGWIERGATVKRSVTMKLRVAWMSGHFVTERFGRDWVWDTGRFEVLTSVLITFQYFWDVTPCRPVRNHLNLKVETLISETRSISFSTAYRPRRRLQLFRHLSVLTALSAERPSAFLLLAFGAGSPAGMLTTVYMCRGVYSCQPWSWRHYRYAPITSDCHWQHLVVSEVCLHEYCLCLGTPSHWDWVSKKLGN
jgi:hypothetical protein